MIEVSVDSLDRSSKKIALFESSFILSEFLFKAINKMLPLSLSVGEHLESRLDVGHVACPDSLPPLLVEILIVVDPEFKFPIAVLCEVCV